MANKDESHRRGSQVVTTNSVLTEELANRVARTLPDTGPAPELRYLSDEDFLHIRGNLLAGRTAAGDLWIFAYGSLLWNPCFPVAQERSGILYGRHRRFCFWLTRWRGTREQPGFMMALDRGGSCRGVLFRVPPGEEETAIDLLLEREMAASPPTNIPCWVVVRSGNETVRAITFVADPIGPSYARNVSEDEAIAVLALAAGHLGSCADYLRRVVSSLEDRNIRDRNLWRRQAKVADFIAGLPPGETLPLYEREVHHACEG